MPLPKLTYFNASGRAEPTRLAFYIGGVQFEDERLSFPEFQERKEGFVAGQVPVLTLEDGEQICQSDAIVRYAGRLANLYPVNNPLAAARVDEALDSMQDFVAPFIATFSMSEDDKKAKRKELMEEHVPKKLEALKKIRGSHEYLGSDSLSIADLSFYSTIASLPGMDYIEDNVLDSSPEMKALFDKIAAVPKIQEWKKRNSSKKYKLTYFDIAGRAEPIRNAFKLAKIDFEDERIKGPQFKELKEKLPGGQVPVLTLEDGSILSQSMAILRFVAQLPSNSGSQLYPTCPKGALKVDEVLGLVGDQYSAIYATIRMEEEEKLKKRKELAETILPKKHKYLESALERLQKDVTDISIADICVHSYVNTIRAGFLDNIPTTLVDGHKRIVETWQRVDDALSKSSEEKN